MTTNGIKAIETVYNGYRFRSRLEARWAVFFDTLGVKYEYEKEGYDLGEAGWYLPDFWLETVHMWAEVKPYAFTEEEDRKCALLARGTKRSVLMLDGEPDYHRLYRYVTWSPEHVFVEEVYPGAVIEEVIPGDWLKFLVYLDDSYLHREHRWWGGEGHRPEEYDASDVTKAAYLAARQARFEHGETPQPRSTVRKMRMVDDRPRALREMGMTIEVGLEDMTPEQRSEWEHERHMRVIEQLRDYLANFDADEDRHHRTPEQRTRDRRDAEYRLRSEELKVQMAELTTRQYAAEKAHDEDALMAVLTEKQALMHERRRIDTLAMGEGRKPRHAPRRHMI